MKQKLFTLFLALVAGAGTMFAWDYEQVSIGDLYYNLDATTKTAQVTYRSYNNRTYNYNEGWNVTTANIPSSVKYNSVTYSVTSIGDYAFRDCSSLTSITIPNSVTSIGSSAFYETGIYDNAANWKNGALYINNCLIQVKGSTSGAYSIESGTRLIADYAFWRCSSLTSVIIPNGVTSIGDYAFEDCSSLTSVSIGNSVTSIGVGAFHICSSLTSITIPNSVTSIGVKAFENCSSLTSVILTALSEEEFCKGQGNSLLYSKGVNYQREIQINGTKVTKFTIPNSVTSIGDYAFWRCSSLTSVTIPNSVTSIRDYAFFNCSSLTSVTIGNSVRSIGDYAFNCEDEDQRGHYHLESVVCRAEKPAIISFSTFEFNVRSTRLYVPCGCGDAYRAAKDWDDFSAYIEMEGYSILIFVNDTKMGTTEVNNKTCKNAQIVATPKPGFRFVQWSDGVVNNPRSIVLTQDTTLIAEFAEVPSYVVEVVYNSDHGTVNGQGTYKEDEEVTLTATANDGYKFHKWSNGVTDNPYTFIVKSDVTLEAKFTSTEGIEDVLSSEVHTTKVIRDGQVLILRNGKTYTMQGQEVK